MSAAKNKEIIRKVNDLSVAGDVEGFLSYCTDTIIWKMIDEADIVGIDNMRAAMSNMQHNPPAVKIDRIIAEDETVMVEGFFEMKEPSGKKISSAFCDIYTISNGKIKEMHSYFNTNAGK